MRTEMVREDNKVAFPVDGRIAVINEIRYYNFQNLMSHTFVVNNIVFGSYNTPESIRHDIMEADRRTIMANKYVERGFLAELDENDQSLASIDSKGEKQEPITDQFLLSKIRTKGKGLQKYLTNLTDTNILDRMITLCLKHNVATNKYLEIKAKKDSFDTDTIHVAFGNE
jgi:hypothetical protein